MIDFNLHSMVTIDYYSIMYLELDYDKIFLILKRSKAFEYGI